MSTPSAAMMRAMFALFRSNARCEMPISEFREAMRLTSRGSWLVFRRMEDERLIVRTRIARDDWQNGLVALTLRGARSIGKSF